MSPARGACVHLLDVEGLCGELVSLCLVHLLALQHLEGAALQALLRRTRGLLDLPPHTQRPGHQHLSAYQEETTGKPADGR